MYQLFPSVEGVRNYHFGSASLNNLANSFLQSSYSQIFNLYSWTFQLINIQFSSIYGFATDSNKQYFINWSSNLLSNNTYQILIKSVDVGINSSMFASPLGLRPSGINQETGNVIIRTERVTVSSGGNLNVSVNTLQSNDSNILDNAQYPYIDTSSGLDDLYYGELEFVPSTGMEEGDISALQARLYILCIPN